MEAIAGVVAAEDQRAEGQEPAKAEPAMWPAILIIVFAVAVVAVIAVRQKAK
jgi:hypothetical protein